MAENNHYPTAPGSRLAGERDEAYSAQRNGSSVDEQFDQDGLLGSKKPMESMQIDEPSAKSPKGIFSIWWPEFLACFLVLASFLALVGTVFPYQDKPMPKWPYSLSINTLISIYVIIFDMALMMVVGSGLGQLKFLWFQRPRQLADLGTFDEGSKGPWGALVLLWVLRARHVIASVGALIMILIIFVAPFSQQLVRYNPCFEIDETMKATIPRSNYIGATGGVHVGAGMQDVDLAAQAAANVGMYVDEPAQVKPFCPTGNCTFTEQYASGGYCSICQDLSDRVIPAENQTANMTMDGWDIGSNGGLYAFVLGISDGVYPGVQIMYGRADEKMKKENPDKCSGGINGGNWTCLGFGAAECSLMPCVRRYNASLSEGKFTENTTSLTTNMTTSPSQGFVLSAVDMKCVTSAERDYLRSKNYEFDDSTEWLAYNTSEQVFQASYTEGENLRDECVYEGSIIDMRSMQSFFAQFFPGFVIQAPKATGTGTSIPGRALFNMGNFNYSHIENKFNNLATSLTVYLRNKGSDILPNSTAPFEGQVERMNTCVNVRWPWITLQAAILILMFTFFGVTLWMVERSGDDTVRHDFKTEVLPLLFLFHGLESQVKKPSTYGVQATSIENQAKKLRVKLSRGRNGWGFSEASG